MFNAMGCFFDIKSVAIESIFDRRTLVKLILHVIDYYRFIFSVLLIRKCFFTAVLLLQKASTVLSLCLRHILYCLV